MADVKFEVVKEDDPRRCQGITARGQCLYKAIENGRMCLMHGGNKEAEAARKAGLKNYRLQQYNERVGELATNPEIKSLREEIGIMRMVLENILVDLKDANRLLIYSTQITTMVGQIQRLVDAAQKMEERNNVLLDRKVVLLIADTMVAIVGKHIHDPDQLNQIGREFCESIIAAGNGGPGQFRAIA